MHRKWTHVPTNDAQWAIPHTFKEAFLGPKAKTPLEVAWLTLNSITTWHIWKIRCVWTYDRKEVIPVASQPMPYGMTLKVRW